MSAVPLPTPDGLLAVAARLGVQIGGAPFTSSTSWLCDVTLGGKPAVLKVSSADEEIDGVRALRAWDGRGAVRVLAQDGDAVVLERAGVPLAAAPLGDDEATEVLCSVAASLHAHPGPASGTFPTLRRWLRDLLQAADRPVERELAQDLLDRAGPPVLLHGDLHHGNVLDSPRGWLAIDPKGLTGPREFDYCNIFTNPTVSAAVAGFDRRVGIVSARAAIEPSLLLGWIAVWSAVSELWHRQDGTDGAAARAVNALALDRLR